MLCGEWERKGERMEGGMLCGELWVVGGGVQFLCSHERSAQCCDSSFSVRVVQLVESVLISTLTSHAGLVSHQSHFTW